MWSCCCSGLPLQANHAEQAASRVGRLRSRMSGATSESTRPSLGVHLLGGGSSGQVWLPVYLKIHTWLTLDKSIARFLRFKWLHVTSCRHFKTSGHEAIKVEKLFTGSLSHVKPVTVVMPLCVSTLKHVVARCCCCCCCCCLCCCCCCRVDKKRDKLERRVLDSQEKAFWNVHRPAVSTKKSRHFVAFTKSVEVLDVVCKHMLHHRVLPSLSHD